MEEKLKFISDLAKACLVPQLERDMDSEPIERGNFDAFGHGLEKNLPILYNLIQQNEQMLFNPNEHEVQNIQAVLIELFCELTVTPPPVYGLKNERLLRNANRLLLQNAQLNDAVEQLLFVQYQCKLTKSCWKRQLGAIHGFIRFLEVRFNDFTPHGRKMSPAWLTFCLSIGLNVRECHEQVYKQIGTRIFLLMLQCANADDIKVLNVHSVIFDAVYKDVNMHFMDTVTATEDIWCCLFKCLDRFDDMHSAKPLHVNDLLETLLRNISVANSVISVCLFKYVRKLCCFFSPNRQKIDDSCAADLSEPSALQACRNMCETNECDTIYHWAKRLLKLFVQESHKLMYAPDTCRQLLQEMHKCYMVCITPIPLQVLEPHLPMFLTKFNAHLLETIVVHILYPDIKKLVWSIIKTFHLQLERSSYCDESKKYASFRTALEDLLDQIPINEENT